MPLFNRFYLEDDEDKKPISGLFNRAQMETPPVPSENEPSALESILPMPIQKPEEVDSKLKHDMTAPDHPLNSGNDDLPKAIEYFKASPWYSQFKKDYPDEEPRWGDKGDYDYVAAYKAGAKPTMLAEDGKYHWPSEFKGSDNPRAIVNGMDTKTGQKIADSSYTGPLSGATGLKETNGLPTDSMTPKKSLGGKLFGQNSDSGVDEYGLSIPTRQHPGKFQTIMNYLLPLVISATSKQGIAPGLMAGMVLNQNAGSKQYQSDMANYAKMRQEAINQKRYEDLGDYRKERLAADTAYKNELIKIAQQNAKSNETRAGREPTVKMNADERYISLMNKYKMGLPITSGDQEWLKSEIKIRRKREGGEGVIPPTQNTNG